MGKKATIRITMKIVTVLLLILMISYTKSQSCTSMSEVEIICSEIDDFNPSQNIYRCIADSAIKSIFPNSSLSSKEASDIDEIIVALVIRYATVKFIPTGIQRKFPSLRRLLIGMSGLLSVNKEDLKEFGSSLESLELGGNEITSINSDLFKYNPNIKLITLWWNPIRHIEPEFFKNLRNLKSIQLVAINALNDATCMNQEFNTALGDDIDTFEWNNGGCFNETARIETRLVPINARIEQSMSYGACLDAKIEKKTDQITETATKIAEVSVERFDHLDDANMKLSQKVEKLKCRIDSIEAKLDSLIDSINNLSAVILAEN